MAEITITGKDGNAILYASMLGEHLRFEFEYFAQNETETDYEFTLTVFPSDFSAISEKFGLVPRVDIFATVQKIQDLGLGQELKDALTDNEIANELFVWRN